MWYFGFCIDIVIYHFAINLGKFYYFCFEFFNLLIKNATYTDYLSKFIA
jgi:hypothetical protein